MRANPPPNRTPPRKEPGEKYGRQKKSRAQKIGPEKNISKNQPGYSAPMLGLKRPALSFFNRVIGRRMLGLNTKYHPGKNHAGQVTTIEDLNGLLQLMAKSALERMLDAAMDVHLSRRPGVVGAANLATAETPLASPTNCRKHSFKFAATLQAAQAGPAPVL
jgi:hypothetical protein